MPATRKTIAVLFSTMTFAAAAAFAQTPISVLSTFSLGSTTLKSLSYTVSISIAYPSGTTASSYVAAAQLRTDFRGFVAAYTPAGDPPEAVLSSVLASILQEYPQMAGASLSASNVVTTTPTGGGTPTSTSSFIDVFQGTYLTPGTSSGVLAGHPIRRVEPNGTISR